MKTKALAVLVLFLAAGPLLAGGLDYNGFHVEGEIVSSALQPFQAPGPPGAGLEDVCFLRVSPYFHHAAPERTDVLVWMQGGATEECLEWGENRRGDVISLHGYLASYEIGGLSVSAVKPTHLSVVGQ